MKKEESDSDDDNSLSTNENVESSSGQLIYFRSV